MAADDAALAGRIRRLIGREQHRLEAQQQEEQLRLAAEAGRRVAEETRLLSEEAAGPTKRVGRITVDLARKLYASANSTVFLGTIGSKPAVVKVTLDAIVASTVM